MNAEDGAASVALRAGSVFGCPQVRDSGPSPPSPLLDQRAQTGYQLGMFGRVTMITSRQPTDARSCHAELAVRRAVESAVSDESTTRRALHPLLPAHGQQILTDLPSLEATRESVITAHLACASAFLPLARELHGQCGLDWPQELDDAVRRHLATTLSIKLPV